MMRQMKWTERTFCFDFPAGVFPGIVERLRGTAPRIEDLIAGRAAAELTRRVAEAWSVQEHIGHLRELHVLDETRLSEYLAGASTLSAADMTNKRTHEARYNDRSAAELLSGFRAERAELVERLEQLDAVHVSRAAVHPRLQRPLRLVDWCFFVAEHDDHHLARIRELLAGS